MAIETDIRYRVNKILEFKGWNLDLNSPDRNVFFENRLPGYYKHRLANKSPDYTLFHEGRPIGIIQTKKINSHLNNALQQGIEYAKILQVPLVLATDGNFCQSHHLEKQKKLYLNGDEVRELLHVKEAIKFIKEKSNDVYTTSKKVVQSRAELIHVFADVNNLLRAEGVRAGIERFSEFANILFIKLLEESNAEYNYWNLIKDVPKDARIAFINGQMIFDVIQDRWGDVFTGLVTRDNNILNTIIERLDPLQLNELDEDIKGGAFEYFLEKTTSTENDLGEYFTPRHIVKSMVYLANPKFGEKVYDPFCGTGGFLTQVYQYVRRTNNLNSDELKILKDESIYGTELTSTSRIAKMNMILYGDAHYGVKQANSLKNPVAQEYDVILSNFPFSQKITYKNEQGKIQNDITRLYQDGLAKNSGDGVCLLHCFQSLKKGGRMAVIVPEGVLFRKELKPLRKFILERSNLKAIISLPPGCFFPYTGVKTNILYLTDIDHVHTKNYWYFKINNDGFTLNNDRRKLQGHNDIDSLNASAIAKTIYHQSDLSFLRKIGAHQIQVSDINLTSQNLVFTDNLDVFSPYQKTVILKDICTIKKGDNITKKTAIQGNIPVIGGGKSSPYSHNQSNYPKDVITISASGTNSGFSWYHDYPIFASDCNIVYVKDSSKYITKYVYYCIKARQPYFYSLKHGSGQAHVYASDFENLKILAPPIDEQHKIVDELNRYQKIVDGLMQAVNNWKPHFFIDDANCYETVKLEYICTIHNGVTYKKSQQTQLITHNCILRANNINISNSINFNDLIFLNENIHINKKKMLNESDILICFSSGSQLHLGKSYIISSNLSNRFYAGGFMRIIRANKQKILPTYLYVALNSNKWKQYIQNTVCATPIKNLNRDIVFNFKIPLPSIEEQEKIVDTIQLERKKIETYSKDILFFEKKIVDKLNSLWTLK